MKQLLNISEHYNAHSVRKKTIMGRNLTLIIVAMYSTLSYGNPNFYKVFNYFHYQFKHTSDYQTKERFIENNSYNNYQLDNPFCESFLFYSYENSEKDIEYMVFLEYMTAFPESFFEKPKKIQEYFQVNKKINFFKESNGLRTLQSDLVHEFQNGKISKSDIVTKQEFDSIIIPQLTFDLIKLVDVDSVNNYIAYNLDYFKHLGWNVNLLIGFNTRPNFYETYDIPNEKHGIKVVNDLFYLTHHNDFLSEKLIVNSAIKKQLKNGNFSEIVKIVNNNEEKNSFIFFDSLPHHDKKLIFFMQLLELNTLMPKPIFLFK